MNHMRSTVVHVRPVIYSTNMPSSSMCSIKCENMCIKRSKKAHELSASECYTVGRTHECRLSVAQNGSGETSQKYNKFLNSINENTWQNRLWVFFFSSLFYRIKLFSRISAAPDFIAIQWPLKILKRIARESHEKTANNIENQLIFYEKKEAAAQQFAFEALTFAACNCFGFSIHGDNVTNVHKLDYPMFGVHCIRFHKQIVRFVDKLFKLLFMLDFPRTVPQKSAAPGPMRFFILRKNTSRCCLHNI